jgi:IS5 family transposase
MRYHRASQKEKGDTNTMIPQVEVALDEIDTYIISEVLDVISSNHLKDKRFRFSDEQILRVMVLKEVKGLSLRDVVKELYSNEMYRRFCKLSNDIPSIETLSYRNSKMDFNSLIQKTVMLYELESGHNPKNVAVDSTVVKPCQNHRAKLQGKCHEYKDNNASWTKTTKNEWEYGYKAHIACDTQTSLVLNYSFATAKEHDSKHFRDLVDSISQTSYVFLDSAYDTENIYNMILEKTKAIPVIDINPRRGNKKLQIKMISSGG